MVKAVCAAVAVVCATLAVLCAVAIEVVNCVAKFALLPKAMAISPNVSNTSGAPPTRLFIAVDIAAAVAVETGLFQSLVLSTLPKPTPSLFRLVKGSSNGSCVLMFDMLRV